MNIRKTSWHLLLLGLVALGLRVPLLADQPYTDEGIYGATSYFIHLAYTGALSAGGWILPKEGALSLYPLLTSWLFFLPWEPFFLLRLFDIIFAATAGIAFYRFLTVALNDGLVALISAVFLILAMNHPIFINAGYKNPILIAVTLTAFALTSLHEGGAKACFRAGLLMSGAVLFREPFLPMAVVVGLYAMTRCGWAGFVRFAAAGLMLAFGVVAIAVWLRGPGGLEGFLSSYFQFNSSIPYRTNLESVLKQGSIASRILLPLVPLVGIGLFAPLGRQTRNRESLELYSLGILLALGPALEIWYKPAFPYHFSQSMLGLTILFALGFRAALQFVQSRYPSHKPAMIIFALFALGGNLMLFHDYARQYYWQAVSAARFAPVMIAGNWQSEATEWSIYLRAARFIRENSPPSASMMTEFVTVGLFPLTHRLPSAAGMGNLRVAVNRGDNVANTTAMKQLLDAPPDIFVLMQRPTIFQEGDHAFTLELTAHYLRRTDQERGLPPYGGWSTQIYLRQPK